MKTNFVEELTWRRMLHDSMPGTDKLLSSERVTGYIGFDPTADSLGVGNLVQVMTLLHFQQAGHRPIALVGGATGMVGDPSGKSAERNLLSPDQLEQNLEGQKKQLMRFLDFSAEGGAELVNNYDWFKGIGFLDFIRDAGKHLTVNYMMAKDSVKNRISGEDREGMSFTEFTYQLIQGWDFTLLDRATVEGLEAEHDQAPQQRLLQKTLAKDITRRVHGAEEVDVALAATEVLFGKGTIDQLRTLSDERFLQVFVEEQEEQPCEPRAGAGGGGRGWASRSCAARGSGAVSGEVGRWRRRREGVRTHL